MHALVEVWDHNLKGNYQWYKDEKLDEIAQIHGFCPNSKRQKVRSQIFYYILSVKISVLWFKVLLIAQISKLENLEGWRYFQNISADINFAVPIVSNYPVDKFGLKQFVLLQGWKLFKNSVTLEVTLLDPLLHNTRQMQFVQNGWDVLLEWDLRLFYSDFWQGEKLSNFVVDFYDLRRYHQRIDVVDNHAIWFVWLLCYFVQSFNKLVHKAEQHMRHENFE